MKKAYLIFGPESSGTRMLTQYITLCSGAFGEWTHEQALDRPENFDLLHPDASVVWRRSLPHGGEWPMIPEMIWELERRHFQVITIGTARKRQDTLDSQFRHGHIKTTERGLTNYDRAAGIVRIIASLVIPFEEFCSARSYREAILKSLDLKVPKREPMVIRPLKDYNA